MTERVLPRRNRRRIQRNSRRNGALPKVVRRHQRTPEWSILDNLHVISVDLLLRLEVERVNVPRVPVERRVLEDDETGGLTVDEELPLEVFVDDGGDPAELGDGDGELVVREVEVGADGTSCRRGKKGIVSSLHRGRGRKEGGGL